MTFKMMLCDVYDVLFEHFPEKSSKFYQLIRMQLLIISSWR